MGDLAWATSKLPCLRTPPDIDVSGRRRRGMQQRPDAPTLEPIPVANNPAISIARCFLETWNFRRRSLTLRDGAPDFRGTRCPNCRNR